MANFFFGAKLWGAIASVPIMKMLAKQAEVNISRALIDADNPGAIESGEYEYKSNHEDGGGTTYQRTYYSCGSCVGYDVNEVKSEYKHLIAQPTHRSAFHTIFGLFEHHMVDWIKIIDQLSCKIKDKKYKTVEDCHKRLKQSFGGENIKDIEHQSVIRNIMDHSNGTTDNYKVLSFKQTKKRC